MAQSSSSAFVHAFEPVGTTFTALQANTQYISNILPHQIVIADTTGQAKMICHENGFGMNRITLGGSVNATVVDTITIDDFCEENSINNVRRPALYDFMRSNVDELYDEINYLGYRVFCIRNDGTPGQELSPVDLRQVSLINAVLLPN
jgi:hypothetical protein